MAKFAKDGAAELYYDNSKKFETTSDGAKTFGDHFFAGTNTNLNWDQSADYLQFFDNAKASFGATSMVLFLPVILRDTILSTALASARAF